MKRLVGVVCLLVVFCSGLLAQDNLNSIVELLRQDVKTKKIALITEIMQFTEKESAAFWPVFRKYDVELQKIGDERIALIKDYAEKYYRLTSTCCDARFNWYGRLLWVLGKDAERIRTVIDAQIFDTFNGPDVHPGEGVSSG